MIARHALFSFGSSMPVCEDPIMEQHILRLSSTMASAVVFVVIVFVLHFELTNFIKRLLRVATFILVFGMCCL